MDEFEQDKLCDKFLFEILERYIRLYNHIEKSIRIASRPGVRLTAQLTISNEAQQLLKNEIIKILQENYKQKNTDQMLEQFKEALNFLADIHQKVLIAVPRPHEPIELISYLRQTFLHKRSSNGKKSIPEVFASETLGDQAHGSYTYLINKEDPQLKQEREHVVFEDGSLLEFAETHLGESAENQINDDPCSFNDESGIGYVSLPRIDLGNPCRWPSLLHEVGHFEARKINFWREFREVIGENQANESQKLIEDLSSSNDNDTIRNELAHWLRECWCDAYAVMTSGPAVFFAQLHAFLFCNPCYLTEPAITGAGYPPAWFRLKLILMLSQARLGSESTETANIIVDAMEEEKRIIFRLYSLENIHKQTEFQQLQPLFVYFSAFLLKQFPKKEYSHKTDILPATLTDLLECLKVGLPIPSIYNEANQCQRAATPEEILLAGWIHRCSDYKNDFLESINKSINNKENDNDELIKVLKIKVNRADECLKRSLQMVEWFCILNKETKSDTKKSDSPNKIEEVANKKPCRLPGLLSDFDIKALLNEKIKEKSLKIIPLLDAEYQIAGSVVDLRLGHNFEIFFSYAKGIIDPLNKEETEVDSMEVDIDFLRSISIVPGQFLLGHTLEYIKLPKNIAAQIEGRSSFARVGLQVHMTANLVEAGFEGCLTLEMTNSGHSTITLYPGMRIAQLRFFRLVTPPTNPYNKDTDKYSGMLSHNKTRQFSDWEVKAFQAAKEKLE